MVDGYLVVHSNPVEGREDEFNDWYTNIHLADVLATPGFVQAQRYAVDQLDPSGPPPQHRYVAMYTIQGSVVDALTALGSRTIEMSTAFATDSQAVLLRPLDPPTTSERT